jgi:hypothetical protein
MTVSHERNEIDEPDNGPWHVPVPPVIPATDFYDCDSLPIYIVTDSECITAITVDLDQAEEMASLFTMHEGHEFHVVCRSATLGPPVPPSLSGLNFDDGDCADDVPF